MTIEQFITKVNAIAKIGLKFSHDPYALENYQELQQLSTEMLNQIVDTPIKTNFYERDIYPTPNISVRTICFNSQGQLLMVKEAAEHLWSLPGGWCDVFENASTNARKEVLQESGYLVEIKQLVALFCRDQVKNPNKRLISEYAIYFSGELVQQIQSFNHEIEAVKFFDLDQLPPLSYKNSAIELERALLAYKNGQTIFD